MDIPGATDYTLSLTNVQPSQAGTYIAHLSNAVGSTDCEPIVVNVDAGIGGAILFSNSSTAPVYDTDGITPLSGPGFLAQLYGALTDSALQPIGAAVPFLSTSTGVFFGGTRHIPDVTAGESARVQIRVWESGRGTTYEAAVTNGSKMGASSILTVPTGGAGQPPSPAAPLVGLSSFALTSNPLPHFAASPSSVVAILGQPVSFNSAVQGEAPLSYQWYFKDTPLAGANGTTLSIASAAVENAGDYRLEAWNSRGTNMSSPATLDVRAGLTLQVGSGGEVRVTPAGSAFTLGSSVQLEAVPADQWLFTGWGGDLSGTLTQATLLMETNHHVSAAFVRGWSASVQSGPGGTAGVTPSQGLLPDGSQAVITATPADGFAFTGWTGDLTGLPNPATVTMTSNIVATALFHDAMPPTVRILSPAAGITDDERVTFSGTITDNLGVATAKWERNGTAMGDLAIVDGAFSVSGLKLTFGENLFRVIASDAAGNVRTNEARAIWIPSRTLVAGSGGQCQEGQRMEIPVGLTSAGDVAGMSFVFRYDAAVLADPQWTWSTGLGSAITTVNSGTAGEIRATFSLPATALPPGSQPVAQLSFRARSVPAATTTTIVPELLDASNPQGNRILAGSHVESGSGTVTPRRIKGDNNGNDRLDVGDASLIQRLVTGLDTARSWDVTGNDLNATSDLDSGDVIRVLRVVVGLDAPPSPPPAEGGKSKHASAKPGMAKDGPAAGLANVIALGPDGQRASAGQLITVQVRLQDPGFPISGASFSIRYPTNALRLTGTQSHKAGSMVPAGSLVMWNVSPAQNNFDTQSGKVTFAAVSATPWPSPSGVLAELTFEVQAGAGANYRWPLELGTAEITRNGYENFALMDTGSYVVGRDPLPARIDAVSLSQGTGPFGFTVTGELGIQYRIDSSTDLHSWTPLGTVTCTDGHATFRDSESASRGWRFYRAVMLP